MTATVALDTVWLHDALDPTDKVRVRSTNGLTRTPEIQGRVQRTAGGGARVIRRSGLLTAWSLSMPWASRTEVDWIESHAGRTVTARDHRGHKLHAVYFKVPVTENGVTTDGQLSLDLQEVTHSEGV